VKGEGRVITIHGEAGRGKGKGQVTSRPGFLILSQETKTTTRGEVLSGRRRGSMAKKRKETAKGTRPTIGRRTPDCVLKGLDAT